MPTTTCYLFSFEEQCESMRAGNRPIYSSRAEVQFPSLLLVLFLRLQNINHETKVFHIAKTEHHLFVHKSWYIPHQWTIAWTCYNAMRQTVAHKNKCYIQINVTVLTQLLNHPLQPTILISNKNKLALFSQIL